MDQYSTLILIALMVVAFYFLIMRPQRRRQQEISRILSALTPGQRVMLGSGLFGTVLSVGEKQVVLEISPGNELTVLKQAVARVVTEGDEDTELDETDLDEDAVTVEPEGPLPVEPEPIRPVNDDREPPATGAGQRPTTAG
ncbi:MAG TPA: preprotein translocase subunit YajC [Propionibacteriaceae bacterium]|jgi:preprotein translocase subunit YajC|nr:preprotein translocase subunit YajC [Propionibacteriaceae bacterium]